MAVASERPNELATGQSTVSARGGPDRHELHDACVDELLNENRRLREIVVYLSEIIIRDVVSRK
jgi:hypothetical protein